MRQRGPNSAPLTSETRTFRTNKVLNIHFSIS
jgi:hypothetical protein